MGQGCHSGQTLYMTEIQAPKQADGRGRNQAHEFCLLKTDSQTLLPNNSKRKIGDKYSTCPGHPRPRDRPPPLRLSGTWQRGERRRKTKCKKKSLRKHEKFDARRREWRLPPQRNVPLEGLAQGLRAGSQIHRDPQLPSNQHCQTACFLAQEEKINPSSNSLICLCYQDHLFQPVLHVTKLKENY